MKKKNFLALIFICLIAVFTAAFSACNVSERPKDVAVTRVSLSLAEMTLNVGETATLYASVAPANATDKSLSWTTDKPDIATVDGGTVTAVAEGTATVTVKSVNNKVASCTVTVTDNTELPPPGGTWVMFDLNGHGTPAPQPSEIIQGKAAKPADPTDGEYDFGGWFENKNCTGAAVDFATNTFGGNTTLYAKWTKKVAPHEHSITYAKVDENSHRKTCSGCSEINVTQAHNFGNDNVCDNCGYIKSVVKPVTGFTLSEGSKTLKMGATETFTLTVTDILPADATEDRTVGWESNDESVATVVNGVVTAKKAGTVTITAKVGNIEKPCIVTVQPADPVAVEATGIVLDKPTLEMKVGETGELTARVTPANATDKNITWSSSAESVATVANGIVTAKGAGTAVITVRTVNDKTATCTVTVTVPETPPAVVEVSGVSLDITSINMETGETANLKATVAPANATDKNITWSSSAESVATVANGVVTAKGAGTAVITVRTVNDKTATCTVTVTAPPPVVKPVTDFTLSEGSKTLKMGATETFTLTVTDILPADATEDRTVGWESNDESVATVVNGVVTAKKAGTVTITAKVGNIEKKCIVTVQAADPVIYTVTFISDGATVDTQTVKKGGLAVQPKQVVKEGYTLTGWAKGSLTGEAYAFDNPVESNLTLYAVWKKNAEETPDVPTPPADSPITYSYAGNECAAFEWTESNAANAKVEYKKSAESAYTQVDKQLIRTLAGGKARVDIVGLAGGVKYDFKITASDGKSYNKNNMEIYSHDRSGYAHFNYSDGVGAYKDDGTLKSGAIVVYVTEATKNTVTAKIDGKTYTGIVSILQNAGTSTPLVVRVIGTVGAATWNKLEHNSGKPLTPDKIIGLNGKVLPKQNWTQEQLISGGYNTLNTSVYSELKGLSSKIKWDATKKEFDSCWNDCSVSGVKNVTVEGIGEDARLFQWGITFRSCNSIEVRNLTFEDYTEDACSFEGGKSEDGATISSFKTKNFWIHHNTFEEGINYWDVCNEQDKHDGDGSTDFKYLSNVTISYNVYNKTHKTGLIGGSDAQHTANITFHHNYYNACKSRLPLARQANMHMYNNFYHGTTSTDISLRANAYALIENCYFDSTKSMHVEIVKGSYGTGAAKIINCNISKSRIFYNADGKKTAYSNSPTPNTYIGTDRNATVNNTNSFSNTFDTDSSVFYYKDGRSDVAEMLTAEQVKTEIPKVAGVQKHGGKVGGVSGGNTGESGGEQTGKTTYAYSVSNHEAVASSNAAGTIAVTGMKAEWNLTGNQISQGADFFTFGGNAYTVTITLNVKKGDAIRVKVKGYCGSKGNTVGIKLAATNATVSGASSFDFSAASFDTKAEEEGTFNLVADANGNVVLAFNRTVAKTTIVTGIEVTVG